MTADERLIEWAIELMVGRGLELPSQMNILQRLTEEGRDERVRRQAKSRSRLRKLLGVARAAPTRHAIPCKESAGIRAEIVVHEGTSTACPPDGGAGRMIERMARSLERLRRCEVIGEIVGAMPEDFRALVIVTYRDCAAPGEVPREGEEAARMMGCSERTYWYRKKAVLEYVSQNLRRTIKRRDEETASLMERLERKAS